MSKVSLSVFNLNTHHAYYNYTFPGAILTNMTCTIECDDQFYCENNFCKPRCDRFTLYSDLYNIVSDVLTLAAGCIGILCSIAVFVVFYIRRKTL